MESSITIFALSIVLQASLHARKCLYLVKYFTRVFYFEHGREHATFYFSRYFLMNVSSRWLLKFFLKSEEAVKRRKTNKAWDTKCKTRAYYKEAKFAGYYSRIRHKGNFPNFTEEKMQFQEINDSSSRNLSSGY